MWQYVDEYLSECAHLSARTVDTYRHHLGMAARASADGRGLADRLRRAGYRPASVASVLRSVRAYARWCVARGHDVPVPRVPRVAQSAPRAGDASDWERMYRVAGARDRLLLLLLRDTGARAGALAALRWEDVDMTARRAVVASKGRRVVLYLSDRLCRALEAARAGAVGSAPVLGLTVSGMRQALRRLAARAGVRGRVNPHAWRHAFARDMLSRGCDLSRLSRLMGHSDIVVTARYYALWGDGELDAAYRRYWDVRDPVLSPDVHPTAR